MEYYALNEWVEVYPSGDGVVAVHTTNDEIHRLNSTAASILQACDGRSREQIALRLREDFTDAPAERVAEDIENTLTELLAKGLIKVVADGRPR